MKEEAGLVFTTIGGLGSSLLGAFFWFIPASILEVKNYGLVKYYIALASIFAGLGATGLNTTVTTSSAKGEGDVLYEANSLTLISGLFLALILSIFQWGSGLLSATMIFILTSYALAPLVLLLAIKLTQQEKLNCKLIFLASLIWSIALTLPFQQESNKGLPPPIHRKK